MSTYRPHGQPEPEKPNSSRTGIIVVVSLVVVAVLIIALASGGSNSPQEWIEERYDRTSSSTDPETATVSWRSTDPVDQVTNAIIAGTDPDDTQMGGGSGSPVTTPTVPVPTDSTTDGTSPIDSTDGAGSVNYLRYGSEWMVAVYEEDGATRIDLDEFDRGYNRHGGGAIFFLWGGHYGKDSGGFFRGGGSGFGK